MRTVILVPRRADHGRRDELWKFTKKWLTKHYPDYTIIEGNCPDDEPFNRSKAINHAAKLAGDWDMAVIHDGDNICDLDSFARAINHAHTNQVMTFPAAAYYYLDRKSSDQIMAGNSLWFIAPQIYNVRPGYAPFLIHKHVSGVQMVPRSVWDKTGGFVENLTGWGSDDSIFTVLCNTLGGGIEWLDGVIYHLIHDHSPVDTDKKLVAANRMKLMQLKRLERTFTRNEEPLRNYLASLGHHVP